MIILSLMELLCNPVKLLSNPWAMRVIRVTRVTYLKNARLSVAVSTVVLGDSSVLVLLGLLCNYPMKLLYFTPMKLLVCTGSSPYSRRSDGNGEHCVRNEHQHLHVAEAAAP